MIEFSIVLSSIVFCIIICELILVKRIPLIATILLLFFGLIFLIQKTDPTYYSEIVTVIGEDDMNQFLFTYSTFDLVVAFIEFFLMLLIKRKKVNSRLGNNTIQAKELVSKEILDEFDKFTSPLMVVSLNENHLEMMTLNKAFQNMYGINDRIINEDSVIQLLVEEDKNAYSTDKYFRLKKNDHIDWFEKCKMNYQGSELCVIKRVDEKSYNDITMGDFQGFNELINSLNKENKDYGMMILHISHIALEQRDKNMDTGEIVINYDEVNDEALRIVLSNKYLSSVRDFFHNQKLSIYQLNSNEFGFVIENKNIFDFLSQEIKKEDNTLIHFLYFIGENKYSVQSKAVLGYSTEMNKKENAVEEVAKALTGLILKEEKVFLVTKDNAIVKKETKPRAKKNQEKKVEQLENTKEKVKTLKKKENKIEENKIELNQIESNQSELIKTKKKNKKE